MKKITAVLMSLSLLFGSCDREDEDDIPNLTANLNRIQVGSNDVFVGSWSVSRFVDGNEDETRSFANVKIHFDADGTVEVTRNNQPLASGNWYLVENGEELWIQLPAFANENEQFGEDIYEINDDWYIARATDTELHLFEENEVMFLQKSVS